MLAAVVIELMLDQIGSGFSSFAFTCVRSRKIPMSSPTMPPWDPRILPFLDQLPSGTILRIRSCAIIDLFYIFDWQTGVFLHWHVKFRGI